MGGAPLVTYRLADADLAMVQRGYGLLARLLFAAGAREACRHNSAAPTAKPTIGRRRRWRIACWIIFGRV